MYKKDGSSPFMGATDLLNDLLYLKVPVKDFLFPEENLLYKKL
jgi:hypothetical protein